MLEIAAGTGEHAAYFAGNFPELEWIPTDGNPSSLASINAWQEEAQRENLLPARHLDVRARPWGIEKVDAVVCTNMIHISPWECTEDLFAESSLVLPENGSLILYGPYFVEGEDTAPSNTAFDESLRLRDPSWGIRWLHVVDELATRVGMTRTRLTKMPANNLSLVYSTRPI